MSFYPNDSGGWTEGEATECGDLNGNPEPGSEEG